ncbi:MAG TPA: hypothetical protein VNZ44_13125 [Pyrinomonadaceae bacterium]|nr:hypothetical protein [Pyrinomonadaceae bacterium]
MSQLAVAARQPAAAAVGAVMGGVAPWFATRLTHGEIPVTWAAGSTALLAAEVAVVLGCCLFSLFSVVRFARAAFDDARKALWFGIAMEGVMLVTHGATSVAALAMLILVNAVSNGCKIAVARAATVKRQADDARRAATRAQNRAAARGARAETPAPAPAPAASAPAASAPAPRRASAPARVPQPAAPEQAPEVEVGQAIIVHPSRGRYAATTETVVYSN